MTEQCSGDVQFILQLNLYSVYSTLADYKKHGTYKQSECINVLPIFTFTQVKLSLGILFSSLIVLMNKHSSTEQSSNV